MEHKSQSLCNEKNVDSSLTATYLLVIKLVSECRDARPQRCMSDHTSYEVNQSKAVALPLQVTYKSLLNSYRLLVPGAINALLHNTTFT